MEKIKVENAVLTLSFIISFIGFISVVRFVDPIFSVFFIILFTTAIYFDYKYIHPIPRYLLNTISLLVVLFMIFNISLNDPVTPVVETLLILLGVKLLEEKKFRDHMQIYTISVFLLSGSALMSIDMIFLLFFISLFFLIVLSMILLTFYSQKKELSFSKEVFIKVITKSAVIPLISIPVTIFIFLILPRTEYPLFNFLNKQAKGKTGFSDVVQLGDISSIQEDQSIVFRVSMEKIDEKDLYWRGITLNYFDGRSWLRLPVKDEKTVLSGKKFTQEIILEPQGNRYLFALDKPLAFYGVTGKIYEDLSFQTVKLSFSRLKYRAVSIISEYMKTEKIDRKMYLQLPENISDRIKKLADYLKGSSDIETINNVLNYINSNYKYSLKNLPVEKNPLEQFLFEKKYGNCEYFASSVAVLLRLNGIPSRLVVGYRGGYYNDIARYYLIPQKFAHVWVEAYTGKRWIRIDPTSSDVYQDISANGISKNKFLLFIDTIEYYWINFVINFDVQKQISALKMIRENLKKPRLSLDTNKSYFVFILFAAFFGILYIFLKNYKRKSIEEKILEDFFKKLKKKGYERKASEGLEEFVEKILEEDVREKALEFVKMFEQFYYRDKKLSSEDIRKLRKIISLI
ncbi:transglutaminase family protein [Persephonella sp.]